MGVNMHVFTVDGSVYSIYMGVCTVHGCVHSTWVCSEYMGVFTVHECVYST